MARVPASVPHHFQTMTTRAMEARIRLIAALAMIAAFVAGAVAAQVPTGTLKKIKDSGDILLTGLAANSRNSSEWAIGTEAFSIDPHALMLPRGDAAFKLVVDGALTGLMKSGETMRIYDKWYAKPIPPKGVTLNFPLSPALKKAFAKPTDSPDPAAYE